jgi:toxin ParE1/3/4
LRALAQVRAAHAYIARDSPGAALAFLDALKALEANLAAFPRIGSETDRPGVMVFPLVRYRYLVFYEIAGNEVRIVRVRHASRSRP